MPGASRAKSARVQTLSALWSLADASRVAWLCAMRRLQRHHRLGPLRPRRSRPASASSRPMYSWYCVLSACMRGLGADVVLAVRQAEPALHQERDVGLLAVDARLHRQAQQVGRSVDAPVQRVDVGAQSAAQQARERRLVRDLVDAIEQRLERREASGLDGGLVQVGGAEVGDLARESIRPARAGVVEQLRDLLAGELLELVAGAPALLACRDRGGLEPGAVGVGEEVVARPDARVDAAFEVRMRPVERLRRRLCVPGDQRKRRGEQQARRRDVELST